MSRFPRLPNRKKTIVKWGLFFSLFAIAIVTADRTIPRQHLPWRSLDIHAPTGFATDLQLLRLSLSPSKTCSELIETAPDYQTRIAEKHRPKDPCGWNTAQEVDGSASARLNPVDVTMQCPLAVGVYIWMREVDDLAQQHLGSGLKSVDHAGAYSCRKQVGNSSGKWSEHAFANALDVMGFTLENGETISILRDWDSQSDKKKAFLRAARKKGCKIFRVTLSPDFNDAHRDHFHFDMGPTTSCR